MLLQSKRHLTLKGCEELQTWRELQRTYRTYTSEEIWSKIKSIPAEKEVGEIRRELGLERRETVRFLSTVGTYTRIERRSP